MTFLPAAFSLAVMLVVMASFWLWIGAFKKLFAGEPLLAYEPRSRPPWNLFDVVMTIVFWLVLQLLFAALVADLGLTGASEMGADVPETVVAPDTVVSSPEAPALTDSAATRWTIVLSGVANLLACGFGALFVVYRSGASWGADLGLTMSQALQDIGRGIAAFAMLAPIVFSIQLILVQWYPSEHPLIVGFRANPTIGLYLVCAFAAAIVAPIFEEFFFRVLLQGLFERIAVSTSLEEALCSWPVQAEDHLVDRLEEHPDLRVEPTEPGQTEDADEPVAEMPSVKQRLLPILFSSVLFAGMHWSHGPDPIPLFVLAVGLGYLYQRTHRILPCVVLHFLLNAFTLIVLALSAITT